MADFLERTLFDDGSLPCVKCQEPDLAPEEAALVVDFDLPKDPSTEDQYTFLPRVTLCTSCYRQVADQLMTTLVRDCAIAEQRDPEKVSLEVSTLAAAWLDEDLEDARTEAFKRVFAGRQPKLAAVKDVFEDVFEDGWNSENAFRYFAIQNAFKAITPEVSGQEVFEGIICSRLLEWAVKSDSEHPLAPIIRAYLKRPPQAVRNNKPTAIITKDYFNIREFAPTGTDNPSVGVGQALLPGLEALLPDYDEMEVFPVLSLFDALRGSDREGALGLRLLITVLTEIDVLESVAGFDGGVLVPTTLRNVTSHLWPRRFDKRYMPRLRAAMVGWETAGVPVEYGGLRRVIGTVGQWIALPDNYPMDGEIVFQVYLPPDARQGAAVHRETLDWLGASHGPMYRAHLTLSHQWWRGARTKGKDKDSITRGTSWPYATRPARRRDKEGNLLDGQGEMIVNRKGHPITNWNDPRTVAHPGQEREPNPAVQYLPSYTDDRLLRLFYSPTQLAGAERTNNVHKYQARSLKYVQEMERLGLLEMAHHGDQIKLCPPRGWGVNFQTPAAVKQLGKRKRQSQ